MTLPIQKPLVFFDIESTGLSVINDRIVEVCFIKIFPDGTEEVRNYRVNPGVPISAEAERIHGISNESVKDLPGFSAYAAEIYAFLNDADFAGFNALKFDIPMLLEELLRNGFDLEIKNRSLIDVQIIFHKMEERTLSAAYKFYCQQDLKNAHSAEADTRATLDVFKAQLTRYEQLKSYSMEQITEFTGVNKRVDLEGKMVRNDKNEIVFNFGKHRGKRVEDVFTQEPAYYTWMMDGEFPAFTKKVITEIRLKMLQNKFK